MQRSFARIVVVCAAAAMFAARSQAQAPTPARTAAARVPTTAPVSPSQTAAAIELLKAIKLEASLPNTSAAMIDSEITRNPGMTPYRDVMLDWLKKYMTWSSMQPELVKLYTDTYSEAELKELAAFYRTPVGQKSLAKNPELMQKTAMIGARLGQEHADELKTLMNARRDELMKQQEKAQAASKTPAAKSPSATKPATPAPKKP
jgi:hypothetical protein